jgi:hypothetical protein
MAPGLVHPEKGAYVSARNFTDGYGYWNYRGGTVVCFLRGHLFKWCHSQTHPGCGIPLWHLQCTRCRKSERNPSECIPSDD